LFSGPGNRVEGFALNIYERKIAGVPQFVSYFQPVIEALQELGGQGSPNQVYAALKERYPPPDDIATQLNKNGRPTWENRVGWARFYLVKAGFLYSPRRGVWGLTEKGRQVEMTDAAAAQAFKEAAATYESDENEDSPPETEAVGTSMNFWFAGASWDAEDQSSRFIKEGVWEASEGADFSDLLSQVKAGDRIAIKSTFIKKHGLPFENRGRAVSVMRIKAVGTVSANPGDGRSLAIAWQPVDPPRDWFFYTYINTLTRAKIEDESMARQLVAFAFESAPQNYEQFLSHPYWAAKYAEEAGLADDDAEQDLPEEDETKKPDYGVKDIITDGAFQSSKALHDMLARLKAKKNLILQGPPGTGKTWLAKRLGYALIGTRDPAPDQLRSVQFHPTVSYEDFVRGYRPGPQGLALTDGMLLQAVEAARAQPDMPHVLVIEEINRGNPAQVFGEMLTLLEHTKRSRSDALQLAYRRSVTEKVHIPENFYLIGTMNLADRSLALVDFAFRRRFAFVALEPELNEAWMLWCAERGIEQSRADMLRERVAELNQQILEDQSLGTEFRIGHSYFTPLESIGNFEEWLTGIVVTEIKPLLDEYWFDDPGKAAAASKALLLGFDAEG
jgi:5-methylcytosine-specific restriction protein B